MNNPMIELTPELRKAITCVFEDGQQNWDHGDGVPHPNSFYGRIYAMVCKLTEYDEDFVANQQAQQQKKPHPSGMETCPCGVYAKGACPHCVEER